MTVRIVWTVINIWSVKPIISHMIRLYVDCIQLVCRPKTLFENVILLHQPLCDIPLHFMSHFMSRHVPLHVMCPLAVLCGSRLYTFKYCGFCSFSVVILHLLIHLYDLICSLYVVVMWLWYVTVLWLQTRRLPLQVRHYSCSNWRGAEVWGCLWDCGKDGSGLGSLSASSSTWPTILPSTLTSTLTSTLFLHLA